MPFIFLAMLLASTAGFVAYVLWPSWPRAAISLDAPPVPVTVAGVLFDVPPAAIRAAVQRQPGAHERIDLVFLWPSLTPPQWIRKTAAKPVAEAVIAGGSAGVAAPNVDEHLFVTIAGLGGVLPPTERLRTIYPRYAESEATSGPNGLAVLPFRAGTPYEGEDLVYLEERPEQFFARCTRKTRAAPATCIHERALAAAAIVLRFPRQWLDDWRAVSTGFDQLVTQLHPHDR